MAELALRKTVLDAPRAASQRVTISGAAPATRLSLRAPAGSLAALSKALGVKLPTKPGASVSGNGLTALWLGPDEWFVFGADGADIAGMLAKVTAFHSAVDISHRNAAFIVDGPGAADIINSGCPRDLSLAAFPVDTGSRTILGKAEIILLREAEDRFRVESWRSFAPYVFDHLEEAARLDR